MRSVVIQVTGLADVASADLGGKTPLEAATTPVLDELASRGILGLTRTVPEGGRPTVSGATAELLGLDQASEVPAPGPVAAAGIGLAVPSGSVAAVLDLVAVAEQEGGGPVVAETRFPALTLEDGATLGAALDEALAPAGARVTAGGPASHVVVFETGTPLAFEGPPDAGLGRPLGDLLPDDARGAALRTLLAHARAALWEHPVCLRMRAAGLAAPTDVWPWGAGAAGSVPAFVDHFGVRGAAVALMAQARGMARLCGLVIEPESLAGAPATLAARVERALALGDDHEFVLLHVETIDQGGARGDVAAKVEAIGRFDAEVVAPVVAGLRAAGGDWRLAVVSDLTSASTTRCFTADPVPFVVATPRDAGRASAPRRRFTERDAREQGIFLAEAHTLLDRLLRR